MHTHTTAGVAVACLQGGLQQTNFYTAQLHDMVAYHDFEGITIHADEGPRLLKSIGDRPAVILRNHGLLAWGQTLPQTFAILWTLQRACEIQMATFRWARAIPVSEEIARKCTRDALQFDPKHGGGPGRVRRAGAAGRPHRRLLQALSEPMKVCIYGAGAIGGWIGAGLAQAGCRLNVVARGATLEALQRDGLSRDARRACARACRSTPVADPADAGRAGPGGGRREGAGAGRRRRAASRRCSGPTRSC